MTAHAWEHGSMGSILPMACKGLDSVPSTTKLNKSTTGDLQGWPEGTHMSTVYTDKYVNMETLYQESVCMLFGPTKLAKG